MRASQGEDVTVIGENTRQPDPVLCVIGIALGVLELKLTSGLIPTFGTLGFVRR